MGFIDTAVSSFAASNPIGAAIGGFGSLLGGILSNKSAARAQARQNAWQAEQNQLQRDWQEEMWNKNNEYNTPEQQRARLEAAGLNPYMMLGNASPVAASQPPGVQPPVGVPEIGAPDALMRGFEGLINSLNASSQTFKVLKDAAKVDQEIEESKSRMLEISEKSKNVHLDNRFLEDTLEFRTQWQEFNMQQAREEVARIQAETRKANAQAALDEFQQKINDEFGRDMAQEQLFKIRNEVDFLVAETFEKYMNGWMSQEKAISEIKERSSRIALNAARASEANAAAVRNMAQAEEASEGAELNRARTEQVREDTEGIRSENKVKAVEASVARRTEEFAVELFEEQVRSARGQANVDEWRGDNPELGMLGPAFIGAAGSFFSGGYRSSRKN